MNRSKRDIKEKHSKSKKRSSSSKGSSKKSNRTSTKRKRSKSSSKESVPATKKQRPLSKTTPFIPGHSDSPLTFDFSKQCVVKLSTAETSSSSTASSSSSVAAKEVHVTDEQGKDVENAKHFAKFSHAKFPSKMAKIFADFKVPTPIQAYSWPWLLEGRDAIGIAATGSGKTLGFVVPGLVHILGNKRVESDDIGPRLVVVAPTRELARQIHDVCEDAGRLCGVSSVCVYGGMPKHEQRRAIENGAEIVIGTPGRMLDLAKDGSLPLHRCTYMVLDEADRMLDMGFEPDIRDIFSRVSKTRQTLLYSATWPEQIQKLGRSFLSKPIKITIGSEDLSATHSVQQIVDVIEAHEKERKLQSLLSKYHRSRKNRIIVFVLYKKEAARVERMLQRARWECVAIHGDKNQTQRIEALDSFKTGRVPLLIATDVAARGLDIPNVEYVINFTFPLTVEDYVHRIGRTGRAGAKGIAHTFFTKWEKNLAGDLCNVLKEANQPVPDDLERFGPSIHKKKPHPIYGNHYKDPSTFKKKSTHIKFN